MRRRFLLWLLIIIFLWVVISQFAEIRKLVHTLMQGHAHWVLLATALTLAFYLFFALVFQSAFSMVGVRYRLHELLPVVFASVFVNTVAPIGGASGVALFVDDAARRGQSPARASAGTLLAFIAEYGTFLLFVLAGLGYLIVNQQVKTYQIIWSVVLVAVVGAMAGALVLGRWQPGWLRWCLDQIQAGLDRVSAWLRRRPLLGEDWAERNATEFAAAAVAIAGRPLAILRTVALAFLMRLISLLSLFALVVAFYQPISAGSLLAGFAMSNLFWLVAITPQGIGLVDYVLASVLITQAVPSTTATGIALAFRGLTFWLPLTVGFLLVRRVKSFGIMTNHAERRTTNAK